MKKLVNIMLALALTIGVAGISLAQDTSSAKTTTKKGKAKKSKDTSKTGDTTKGKTKGKKGGDTSAPATK